MIRCTGREGLNQGAAADYKAAAGQGGHAGAMAFEPGQMVGDYEILRPLGAGGLGAVYEVRHLISQRHEAMKILLPDQSGAPEMVGAVSPRGADACDLKPPEHCAAAYGLL